MNEITRLKSQISSRFSIGGFQIRSDASTFLAQQIQPLSETERKTWITNVANHVQSQNLAQPIVERKHIEQAIKEASNTGLDDAETVFQVISAFEVPSFVYVEEKKKFLPAPTSTKLQLLGPPDAKSNYLRERYLMLWQKTHRHEMFSQRSTPGTITGTGKSKLTLRKVENLLSTSKMNDVVMLGLLTQLTEGRFYLEDPTGSVPIDLSTTAFSAGLFCEGCFVLACGKFRDGTLKIEEIGFPPPELAASSRAFFGSVNSWGGPSKTLLKNSRNLAELEKGNPDHSLIFVSDCWLDSAEVMEKLKQLLKGYDDFPPVAIVLMGPFGKQQDNVYGLKSRFQMLGELLSTCEKLKAQTDLVLVPSCDDPAAANILPRPPIPNAIAGELVKRYPRTILATNPCRLQYCTQQIVVCRADLVTKLCRNTIHFPKQGHLEEHFARTLISQGTLAPLHPIAFPTHWSYDAALSLYPLPDLVVIGDPCQAFQTTEQDCTVMNVGSFPKSKFAFKVYYPSNRTVEDSQIPDEDD
ncbi:DNA polymerase epsilon subunit 2 [Anopheles darlingi]|uniref:DNA polymerase epsilon subunit n=1 Tax=Anopheles darlingi TaxID=43151 RepID=W5J996_ANODA|nr:DNA polymerase epsilon subunit 2 [Anopheles darlingi]